MFNTFSLFETKSLFGWLFLLSVPLLFKHGRAVYHSKNGEELRSMMATMVKCALLTNLLFALGIILS